MSAFLRRASTLLLLGFCCFCEGGCMMHWTNQGISTEQIRR